MSTGRLNYGDFGNEYHLIYDTKNEVSLFLRTNSLLHFVATVANTSTSILPHFAVSYTLSYDLCAHTLEIDQASTYGVS